MTGPSLTPMQSVVSGLLLFVLYRFFDSLRRHAKLQHIPSICPSGIFSSYRGAIRWFRNARDIVQEGYDKVRDSIIGDTWLLVTTD